MANGMRNYSTPTGRRRVAGERSGPLGSRDWGSRISSAVLLEEHEQGPQPAIPCVHSRIPLACLLGKLRSALGIGSDRQRDKSLRPMQEYKDLLTPLD